MNAEIEIPAGYVLVKKGGRPPKTMRDIAVFLAYLWKKEELGKGYLADEWILENFKLKDAVQSRKCRSNAKIVLPYTGLTITDHKKFLLHLTALKIAPGGLIKVTKGARGWIWGPGFTEASEVAACDGFLLPGHK